MVKPSGGISLVEPNINVKPTGRHAFDLNTRPDKHLMVMVTRRLATTNGITSVPGPSVPELG